MKLLVTKIGVWALWFGFCSFLARSQNSEKCNCSLHLDIWLVVHHSITFLLLPTWYTKFLVHSHKLQRIKFFLVLEYLFCLFSNANLDIWLVVHHSITFLLLPTWYTKFLVHSHKLQRIKFFLVLEYLFCLFSNANLDIWLAVHHNITFLLLPTWYTNFLFIHINYIKLN